MKCLISLFIFLVMGSVSSAGVFRLGGKIFGNRNIGELESLKSIVNRKVGDLFNEKSISEIIRDIPHDPHFANFTINPEDVAALLYVGAMRKLHHSGLRGLSGQGLENMKAIRESLSTAFGDDDDVRVVQIGNVELQTSIPVGVKKLKIGDFEFEINDILSSFFFKTEDARVDHYILINLSDFTKPGRVDDLIRLWDHGVVLQRELPEILEKHHLVGNPELVLKWFEKSVGHSQHDIILKRLNGFIIESNLSPDPDHVIDNAAFVETVLEATKRNHRFEDYFTYLLNKARKEMSGGEIERPWDSLR